MSACHVNNFPYNFCMGVDIVRIKELREKKGWTLQQAAEAAGMNSRQRWSDIESGRNPDLRVTTLEAIAKALGVSAKSLLTDGK